MALMALMALMAHPPLRGARIAFVVTPPLISKGGWESSAFSNLRKGSTPTRDSDAGKLGLRVLAVDWSR